MLDPYVCRDKAIRREVAAPKKHDPIVERSSRFFSRLNVQANLSSQLRGW